MTTPTQPIPLTDLRIGNLILIDNLLHPEGLKYEVHDESFIELIPGKFWGIPLSWDLIKETNLDEIIKASHYYNNGTRNIELLNHTEFYFEYEYSNYETYHTVQIGRSFIYLHDLQNAVKEIFGTELTIK